MAFASPAFAGLPLSSGTSCWDMSYGPKSGVSSGQLEAAPRIPIKYTDIT